MIYKGLIFRYYPVEFKPKTFFRLLDIFNFFGLLFSKQ